MESDLLGPLAQFGAAGLMACMWLVERRAAGARERQLDEAHTRLMEQRVQLDALVTLVRDNTRAVASLETAQRALASAVARLSRPRPAGRAPTPGAEIAERPGTLAL